MAAIVVVLLTVVYTAAHPAPFGLRLAGVGYALVFSIITAVAIIVPYFGALASSIPPILYGFAISPGKGLLVAVIYIAIHQLEGNVIEPLVMARAVKLHPAVVTVSVVAVESLFGFIGLFVAVPILATIKILIEELWINSIETTAAPLAVVGLRSRPSVRVKPSARVKRRRDVAPGLADALDRAREVRQAGFVRFVTARLGPAAPRVAASTWASG